MAVDHYRQHRSAAELIDIAKKGKRKKKKRGSMDPLCLPEALL